MNKKMRKLSKLKIPKFADEDEERNYWAKIDLSQHFKREDFKPVHFPNLLPSSHPISIRIPNYLLMRVKEKANQLNVPYQSLIKEYIAEGAGSRDKVKAR